MDFWIVAFESFDFCVLMQEDTFECFGVQILSIFFWDMHVQITTKDFEI
jgi:hypothetical protein